MKKTLLIIGLILVALVVAIGIWDRVSGRYARQKEVWKFNQQSHELAAKQIAEINTSLSYIHNGKGEIISRPASPRIELKINGSDQPLRGKAPLSFTLSWKIDPAFGLDLCTIDGPDVRNGYTLNRWGFVDDILKTNEGSWEFKDVMPGPLGDGIEPSNAALYNGVASFDQRENFISISCGGGYESNDRIVSVWLD